MIKINTYVCRYLVPVCLEEVFSTQISNSTKRSWVMNDIHKNTGDAAIEVHRIINNQLKRETRLLAPV